MSSAKAQSSQETIKSVDAPQPVPAQAQLVQSCQGLVKSLAWKIKQKLPKQVELDDLIGYGQLGLVQAAQDFDPNRGGQFTTYAYYRIRGAILDGLSQMAWFSRADYHRSRYERMAGELLSADAEDPEAGESGSGRAATSPDSEEGLAAESGWFASMACRLAVVYLASASGADEAEALVDGAPAPPAEAIAREMRQKLMESIATLPAAAQTLIRATYFEGVTLQEAGRRIGISKAWASRLHARALAQLARAMRRADQGDHQ